MIVSRFRKMAVSFAKHTSHVATSFDALRCIALHGYKRISSLWLAVNARGYFLT
jgi:hypothetical protein